ncbi:HlyD family type I secretion periplasmic adaptor subunit [Novosphingobium sp. M1R2S20]|uniref:Membrane fusion protein (MFP) family protein n=1 Tax=Novosphingobium rhizovicinum TaxID=3228928 RepID=A0ABV3R8E6_9SPHN
MSATVMTAPASTLQECAIERSLQRTRSVALVALAVLFLGFGLAAVLVPIGGSVVGQGRVGAESSVKRISHPNGGVVAEIHVRDGDRVKAGQLLMRLDTSVSKVSANLSAQSVDQLLAQQARLAAESQGLSAINFPPELASRSDTSALQAMEAERRLFGLRATGREGLRSQLHERTRQLREQIGGFQTQIAALGKQQALIEPEREGVRQLWERGLVTISRRNQLERTAVDLEGSIGALQASIAEARARISEINEQAISLNQNARTEAGAELAQVTAALNEQRVRSASAGDQYSRSLIKAPYDGVVDKLAMTTIGGVIPPAETIMEIVPDRDRMIVEAGISPTDVDRVRIGQEVRVRLSAFNGQTTPEFAGEVNFVSAERMEDRATGASFYRIHVRLDQDAVRREGLQLKPGMPAEVFVSTGSRSMLSYLTKPFRDQLARAFNE